MPNPVVHFEVEGPDGAALQEFYGGVFGWSINADNPMNYGLVDNDGEGIGGGIGSADVANATFYIAVDDPAAFLERATVAGGTVVQDVTEIPGMVTLAKFADPAGNIVGIVKADD